MQSNRPSFAQEKAVPVTSPGEAPSAGLEPISELNQTAGLSRTARTSTELWDTFKNPGLQAEIAALTPAERVLVDRVADAVVREIGEVKCPAFWLYTKKNGDPHAPLAEHATYTVLQHKDFSRSALKAGIIEKLLKEQPEAIYAAMGAGELASATTVRIFEHPQDASSIVVQLRSRVPRGHCLNDSRCVGCNATLMIGDGSELARYLESGRDLHLLSFIIRNAAVAIDDEKRSNLDAPFSGEHGLHGEGKNSIYLLDFRRCRILHTKDAPCAETRELTCGDPLSFVEKAAIYRLSAARDIFTDWKRVEERRPIPLIGGLLGLSYRTGSRIAGLRKAPHELTMEDVDRHMNI